jgi:PBP1b-binding outer membrane lipoprotein LpoB
MNKRLLAVLVVTLMASGCSREKAEGGAASITKTSTPAGSEPVAAVLQSTGTPVAKLGFVLVTQPVVGRQSELRLDLSSATTIGALQVRTESESFNIDSTTAQASVKVEAGQTATHDVKLIPKSAGLTQVTVRLQSDDGSEAVYAIPVLVAATAAGD